MSCVALRKASSVAISTMMPKSFCGEKPPSDAITTSSADLGQQHPAAPPSQYRHRIAIQQRRPEEFPGVGKLDQREQADDLEIDVLGAQPGGNQIEQQDTAAGRKRIR